MSNWERFASAGLSGLSREAAILNAKTAHSQVIERHCHISDWEWPCTKQTVYDYNFRQGGDG